ncbi:MAG: hypothetical protein WAK12_02150 [Acidimicrobiales bacterium]
MGSSGDKPRKPRRRLAKVPRGAEPNNIQLAGLSNSSGGSYGSRVDHDKAHGRSENVGKFGRFVLWCLGKRRTPPEELENP